MLNKNILIPGIFIEKLSDHSVYQIQTTIGQAIVLRNIGTDVITTIPLSEINCNEYEVVTIEPNYVM